MRHLFVLILTLSIIQVCVGPPAPTKKESTKKEDDKKEHSQEQDELGLEYNRYLQEVVEALESDPEFRKKLETADEADFRSGKVAAELEFVNHHVRTKLDELKRQELQRLNELVQQADDFEKNRLDVHEEPQSHRHIDAHNPHSFEVADLHKLITKVREDLYEADKKRREEFKEYELQKEFEEQQKMKELSEKEKDEYLKKKEEMQKKHKEHQPLHHPGSKAQLEEVWEKQDHMEHQKFNPKTFFYLHDLDGNGYWDEQEVKTLFLKELDKMYEAGAPEDDMKERQEEMERMREHVFKESDTNKDGLISFEEFLEQTKKQEFQQDEGWETLDQQQLFTQQEYEEFEKKRQEEIQRLIEQGVLQPHPPGMAHSPHHIPHHAYPHVAQQMYPPSHHGVPVQHYQTNQGHASPQHPNAHYPQQQQYHPQQVYHPQPQQVYHGQQHPNLPHQPPPQGGNPSPPPHQGSHQSNDVPSHNAPPQQANAMPSQQVNAAPHHASAMPPYQGAPGGNEMPSYQGAHQGGNRIPPQHGNGMPPQHGNGMPPQHGNGMPPQHGNGMPPQHGNGMPPQHGNPVPSQQGNALPPQQGSAMPSHHPSAMPSHQPNAIPPVHSGSPQAPHPSQFQQQQYQMGNQMQYGGGPNYPGGPQPNHPGGGNLPPGQFQSPPPSFNPNQQPQQHQPNMGGSYQQAPVSSTSQKTHQGDPVNPSFNSNQLHSMNSNIGPQNFDTKQ